jgi:hypothetical protein
MPKQPKSVRATAKSPKAPSLKALPLERAGASKVQGGKRTAVRDGHDKYANQ